MFTELDKNGDDKVSQEELTRFVTENQMIEGLVPGDVGKLFSFFDSN